MPNFDVNDVRVRKALFLSDAELAFEGASPEEIAQLRKAQREGQIDGMTDDQKRDAALALVQQGATLPAYLKEYAPEIREEKATVASLFGQTTTPTKAAAKKEGV